MDKTIPDGAVESGRNSENTAAAAGEAALMRRRALLRATLAGGAVVATLRPAMALAASGMVCDVNVLGTVYDYKKGNDRRKLLYFKGYYYDLANGSVFTPPNGGKLDNPISPYIIPSKKLDSALPPKSPPGDLERHEVTLLNKTVTTGGLTQSGCAGSFFNRIGAGMMR